MPVRTNAHHTQFPATPVRLTMSVTRLGVSALKVVATIDKPASHHGTARPDPKNSEVLRPARLAKNSAGPKQMRSEAPTMNQSSAVRCMNDRVQSTAPLDESRGDLRQSKVIYSQGRCALGC